MYAAMGVAREMSGGSAANSMAGVAAMGGASAFIGQVAEDQLGLIFEHDMHALGVRFETPALEAWAADGALPDPGDAGRPAVDEYLPRCES